MNAGFSAFKEVNGRRKIMELEVRNALHIIRCFGVSASEPQCSAESAAIDEEKAALQAEYNRHTPRLMGNGFLSVQPSHPTSKNRNGPSFNTVVRIHMDNKFLPYQAQMCRREGFRSI
jgi:hypothetical protein